MMKKLASLMLVAAMAVTAMVAPVHAANEPEISIEIVGEVEAGKEVKANVVIENNPGLTSLKVALTAPEGFTLVTEEVEGQKVIKAEEGEVFGTTVAGPRLFVRNQTTTTKNGVIATVTFIADKDLEAGEYEFTVDIVEAMNNATDLTNTITEGKTTVEVECDHVEDKGTVTKEPTCTEKGTKEYKCTECGEVLRTEEIAATGHKMGEWKVTKEPTCTEKGEETRECTVCGHKETREVAAAGHTWGEWEVTKEATCTEAGEETRECEVCGEVETNPIPAKGHDYDEDGICKECGAADPDHVETETGDNNMIGLYAAVLGLAALGLVVLRKKEGLVK